MVHAKGETLEFEAQRSARAFKRLFQKGQKVRVVLKRDWDEEDDMGDGGPWGWGGYTSAVLRRIGTPVE